MHSFDLEYKLNEFRNEAKELFDENGKRYTGVGLSDRQAELMLELINELDKELKFTESLLDMNNLGQSQSPAPRVSCRAFVLERAKKYLGNRFKHLRTGTILTGDTLTWSVNVAKCFGGMYVTYGGWVVWSASVAI